MNQDLTPRISERVDHFHVDPLHAVDSVNAPSSFVGIVLRRKTTIALFAIVCGLLAYAATAPRTRIYRAHSTLEFSGLNDNVLNTRSVDPSATTDNSSLAYINTQARVLQSTPLLNRVIKSVQNAKSSDPSKSSDASERHREALANLTPQSLLSNVEIRVGDMSRILDIYVDSPDPNLATEIANAIPREYMALTLEARVDAARQTGSWLGQQLAEARQKLERSEAGLQAYARRSNLVFTHEDGSVAEARLRDLQAEYSRAQGDRMAREAVYTSVIAEQPDALNATLKDPALQEYQSKLSDLNRQMADLTPTYQPTNQKVKRLASQIEELTKDYNKQRDAALNRLRNEFETAQRREEMLQKAYLGQEGQVTAEASTAVDYNILKREAETNRSIYQGMLQNVTSYGIASAMQPSNARIVESAEVPLFPYKPNVPLTTMFGLMGGTLLGLVWVGMRDKGEINVEYPGQTSTILQAKELGVIPSARLDPNLKVGRVKQLQSASWPGRAENRLLQRQQVGMAMLHGKYSLLAESIRSIRTSLMAKRIHGVGLRSAVITSLTPAQGKTSFASNLGIAYAELNKRVLLIDGDVRNPGLHKIFGLQNRLGLTNLLSAPEALQGHRTDGFVQETSVPNLSLLCSGPVIAGTSVSSLFHSEQMQQLMNHFSTWFDVILIDTPPLTLTDARILGAHADGMILVLRAGDVRLDSVQAAEQRLAQDGCRLLGTVLNDWNPRSNGYGIYSERYHKSAYYTTIVQS